MGLLSDKTAGRVAIGAYVIWAAARATRAARRVPVEGLMFSAQDVRCDAVR
jgi:hypothetical protein